jgi:hypothetical protein
MFGQLFLHLSQFNTQVVQRADIRIENMRQAFLHPGQAGFDMFKA